MRITPSNLFTDWLGCVYYLDKCIFRPVVFSPPHRFDPTLIAPVRSNLGRDSPLFAAMLFLFFLALDNAFALIEAHPTHHLPIALHIRLRISGGKSLTIPLP